MNTKKPWYFILFGMGITVIFYSLISFLFIVRYLFYLYISFPVCYGLPPHFCLKRLRISKKYFYDNFVRFNAAKIVCGYSLALLAIFLKSKFSLYIRSAENTVLATFFLIFFEIYRLNIIVWIKNILPHTWHK